MKKHELRGAGTVFRYTMQQHYKTRSVIIFLLVLLVISLAVFPLVALVSGSKAQIEETAITRLYIRNETGFPLVTDALKADARYQNTEIVETDTSNENLAQILWDEDNSAAAVLTFEGGMRFRVQGYYGEKSAVTSADVSTVTNILESCLHDGILQSLDVTQEQADTVRCKAFSSVASIEDYLNPDGAHEADPATHMFANMFYCYLILIISALAMSYIFQFCMEEKVSKLVESLLVSVSPTALLVGKIAAATCMIGIGIGLIGIGLVISWHLAGMFGDLSMLKDSISVYLGFDPAALHINVGILLLILLCVVLAYANTAFLSGIAGSCCSKPEDSQNASLLIVGVLMIGYMGAALAPTAESESLSLFISIFPVTGIFCALPNFVCGKIGLPVLLVSLLLQAASAVLLARTAGSVYKMMLLYRGNVPKPKQLLQMLRESRAAEKAAAGKGDSHEA